MEEALQCLSHETLHERSKGRGCAWQILITIRIGQTQGRTTDQPNFEVVRIMQISLMKDTNLSLIDYPARGR